MAQVEDDEGDGDRKHGRNLRKRVKRITFSLQDELTQWKMHDILIVKNFIIEKHRCSTLQMQVANPTLFILHGTSKYT